jgi:DNA primase large subunit
MLASKEDFAKYPFMREVSEYVKRLDLKTDELAQPEFLEVLSRAEERVEEALFEGIIKWKALPEHEIEILSYPVAVIFVAKIGDNYLKKRYALAEAKRIYNLLKGELEEKLIEIAKSVFAWRVQRLPLGVNQPYVFSLSFIDYLKNAPAFHDYRWKLVNRVLIDGGVLLMKDELARLISEEVRKHIEKTVEESPEAELHPLLIRRVERIGQMLSQRREKIRIEELPRGIVSAAYPPCIKRLYDSLVAGQHISHVGRFTLTSFLLNVGMTVDKLIEMYTSLSDFNQRLTRYQVEHIAGVRGSGVKYTPPSCDTLRTHGLCPGPDEVCERVKHPLSYYRRKIRLIRRGRRGGKGD